MKLKNILIVFLLAISCPAISQINSTAQLLDAMQTRYRGNWFQEFTFEQETIRYDQSGAVRDTAIWNEAVKYPDYFRIDFGQPGRFVIFRNDSSYRFDNYELDRTRLEPQEFLLFKGGLYFRPAHTILEKLTEYGYDINIFREDRLNGHRVYVIGAEKGDLRTKQFWVSADHFYTMRRISSLGNGSVLDVQYSDHKNVSGGWVEQTVSFFRDGRKIQIEYYKKIDASEKLPSSVFDPKNPLRDWFKK